MHSKYFLVVICITASVHVEVAHAADTDQLTELRSEINSLKQGQKRMEKDLSAIKGHSFW
jgi:peptidoglycan hydrolase CwlO-like protein